MVFTLAACSGSPLSLLTGGGPNVAANTQLGQENSQTVGQSQSVDQSIRDVTTDTIIQSADKGGVKGETIEAVTVNNIEPWIIVLLVLGWLLPSPGEIGRTIKSWFQK